MIIDDRKIQGVQVWVRQSSEKTAQEYHQGRREIEKIAEREREVYEAGDRELFQVNLKLTETPTRFVLPSALKHQFPSSESLKSSRGEERQPVVSAFKPFTPGSVRFGD